MHGRDLGRSSTRSRIGADTPTAAAVATGVAAVAAGGVCLRRWWARRLTHHLTGEGPGIRTDDGVLLHVECDGPDDAPWTMVLAHGLAARSQAYEPLRAGLAGHVRVVSFDLRGHGRSGWGHRRAATIDRLGRDLGEVVDQVGTGPVIVVGHSLGGMAVMALAEQRPELFGSRIVAVALLSTSAGGLAPSLPGPATRSHVAVLLSRPLLWLLWFLAPVTERLQPVRSGWGRWLLRRQLFGSGPVAPELVTTMQDMWADTPRPVASALYPDILSHDRVDALRVLARLPMLVLTGADDRTIPPEHSERIAAAAGERSASVVVPGAGHMVTLTHPAAVDEALRHLLGTLES